jgi:hypothetical protein
LNPFSYELELFALALALYLYDSSVLLFSNEALLTAKGTGRWGVELGFSGFLLGGRGLCILNPFAPHQAAFRLSWNFARLDLGTEDIRWSQRTDSLRRLRVTTWLSAAALFAVLPLGLFSPLGAFAVIPALVLLYGSAIVGLLQFRVVRHELGYEGARYAGFIFECLACPPFAANMIRRITLQQRIPEPLPRAGARLLPAGEWTRLRSYCETRLDGELQRLDENSAERVQLDAAKRALRSLSISQ